MTFKILPSILSLNNDETNYKNSGLPKFKKYKPRLFLKNQNNASVVCIENIQELQQVLLNHYNDDSLSLYNIIDLYIQHDIIVSESVVLNIPTAEVNEFREYDRSRYLYCSKRTPEQYDELYEDIKQNGINNGGRIRIQTVDENTVQVILGEGNHRLSIAKLLGLDHIPIVIRYVI